MKNNRFILAATIIVVISLIYAYMYHFVYADKKYIVMVEYEYWIEELESEVEGLKLNHTYILKNFNHAIREKIYKNNSKIAIGIPYITRINLDYMYLKGDNVTDMLSFIEKNSKDILKEVITQADIKDIYKNIGSNFYKYCRICERLESDAKVAQDNPCQNVKKDRILFNNKSFETLKNKYCNGDGNEILEEKPVQKILFNATNNYYTALDMSRGSIFHAAAESYESKTHIRVKRIYTGAF